MAEQTPDMASPGRLELEQVLGTGEPHRIVPVLWNLVYEDLRRFFRLRDVPEHEIADLIQNVFCLVVKDPNLATRPHLLGWVFKLASYEFRTWSTGLSRRRNFARRCWQLVCQETASSAPWADDLQAHLDAQAVEKVLMRRDPIDAEIFRAHYVLGATDVEIVQILDAMFDTPLSVSNVKIRLHRLRKSLRKLFTLRLVSESSRRSRP